jgi:hypothetical protein
MARNEHDPCGARFPYRCRRWCEDRTSIPQG